MLLALLGLGCTLAAAEPPRAGARQPAVPRAETPVVQDILNTPIGDPPVEAMHWPEALETLGRPREAATLRQALLLRWLASLQPAGNFAPATETVGQAIESVGTPDHTARTRDAKAWWNALLSRQLRIALPEASVPLPDEIGSLRERLVNLRPGVWVLRDNAKAPVASPVPGLPPAPGVFALVELRNTGSQALALGPFELELLPQRAAADGATPAWSMACEMPRYQPRAALAPDKALPYLCRGPALQGAAEDAGAALQAAQQQGRLRIRSNALDSESERSAVVSALAQPRQDALRSFLAANASCQQRGTCDAEAREARSRAAMAPPATQAGQRDGWAALEWWGIVLAGAVVYVAIARYVGVGAASFALFVALAVVPAVQVFQSARTMNTADNWGGFVVIPMMGMAILVPIAVPAIAAWTYRTATDPHKRRRVMQTTGYFVITVLGLALISRILHLLS
jgi:hypothetical protein